MVSQIVETGDGLIERKYTMPWTYFIGIALLAWVAYDLFTGRVWLHRAFDRASEPGGYWGLMVLWLVLALSFFYW
jgi:hypothetical protein